MKLAFRILNVFTVAGDPFSGNPLCVFEDARGLSEPQMQGLARQMNLSESTFVFPSTTDAADALVRIFTPTFEMPFAGHPTLGTAAVVAGGRARVTLEMRAGLVPVTAEEGSRFTLRTAGAPVTRPVEASRAELADMLGLPEEAIGDAPLWVDTGSEQLVIPLVNAGYVRKAEPSADGMRRHGRTKARSDTLAYLWARPAGGETEHTVRFFFTSNGAVIEDPATGSACANLGGWHVATGAALPLTITLRQGDAVQRPSRLVLRVESDGAIFVSGTVHELARGSLEL